MTCLNRCLKRAAFILFALSYCLLADAYAQKRQAVVILRPPGGVAIAPCDGATEVNYQIVSEAKLHNKEEVRMAGNLGSTNGSTLVSRKEYEDTRKAKLRDLFALKWSENGVLYAVSVEGQTPVAILPDDTKPQKDSRQRLSSFYEVMFTGAALEGKQKRQLSLPLRDIMKIYFVPEGAPVNETLFRHAAEEKSVVLWEAYMRKTNSYKQAEAGSYMRDALINCARADLDSFTAGAYGSLDKARQRAERAHAFRSDPVTQQLIDNIGLSQRKVDGHRAQAEELMRAGRYDDAINAVEPIKIYLSSWPVLNDMYKDVLTKSHNQHLTNGENALDANQLDKSLAECTLAWKRVDTQPARACMCKSRNRVALRDSKNLRLQRRPKDAKEMLERQLADADCTRDDAVATALNESKCEYSQQLLAESRQLVGGGGAGPASVVPASFPAPQRQGKRRAPGASAPAPAKPSFTGVKAINARNKQDFRNAREKLMLANEMCQDDSVRTLLAAVNRSLSGYCFAEAQKAVQRGDAGTAYVYLQTAQGYTPDDQNVLNLLAQARNDFEERTRVSVGAVFGASGSDGHQIVNEVAAEVESAAAGAGLAQPIVLDRRQAAERLRAIQSGQALNSPTIIFFGDLVRKNIAVTPNSRLVRSSVQYENPYWKQADRVHDARNEVLKRCRKQPGADCSGLQAEVDSLRAQRDRHERNVTEYYNYRETHITVAGDLHLSFRATDSVSRSTRAADTLQAAVSQQCVAREGVRDGDYNAGGNRSCAEIGNEYSYMQQMVETVKNDAQRRAHIYLSALPLSYYGRARSTANKQQSIEDYLRFLFLTRDKNSSEAIEAQNALVAFDPELKTDGVLR